VLREESKRQTLWRVGYDRRNTVRPTCGSERAAELGSKHSSRVTFRCRPDMLELPGRPLKSTEEVCELLEETINLARQGLLDLHVANAIGFLAGILLKALDQRVESPETTNSEASPGTYTSLFQRLALPLAPQDRVFDLFPQPAQKDAGIASGPVPAPGEFIDDTPTRPNTHHRVSTVEAG
jgi:hypothetical protein